jgi:hypothetical protein
MKTIISAIASLEITKFLFNLESLNQTTRESEDLNSESKSELSVKRV